MGVYDVTFAGVTPMEPVSGGDVLQVDVVQGDGLPCHGCAGIESVIMYDINYYMVDKLTNDSYFINSSPIGRFGENCDLPYAYWTHVGMQDITVPCNIPSGEYWLRIEIDNVASYAAGGISSSPQFYANDVNIGETTWFSCLNEPFASPLAEQMYADVLEITVSNPNVFSDITISTINSNCNSLDGSITATPVGGVGPFTYQWYSISPEDFPPYYTQTPIGQTTETATNLGVGNYSVTIVDQGTGCEISTIANLQQNIVLTYPYELESSLSITHPCSFDEGEITVLINNGTLPYTYDWSNGDETETSSNLTAGAYSVLITDAAGCSKVLSATLTTQIQSWYFDYPNGLVITSPSQQIEDFNGDGVVRIRGTLVFKDKVNYTFSNKTIQFARDLEPESVDQGRTHSGMIVEKGSKVTANNVVFRGLPVCNSMWDGIQVWGDDYERLQRNNNRIVGVPFRNGILNLNNCSVRDAHIGVALYRVNLPWNSFKIEYGRGVLHATSTSFLNNNIGVDFKSNNYIVNNSTIKGCTFTCDQPLINQHIYQGKGSDVFIRLQGVKNPLIVASVFNGNTNFSVGERGTGIRSYGSGYVVQSGNAGMVSSITPPQPNVFNNLDQGIDIYSFGGAANTVRIKDNRFNNVYQGITSNGSNFDEVSFNIFNIPAGDVNFNSWGIFLQTSSGFLATQNTFNTSGTSAYTFGVVTRNVNLINGELYKNTFNGDFNSATQAEGTSNNQLQIDCNRYFGNNAYDWTVLSSNMADQGFCSETATDAATNIFSECITADERNVFSFANFGYSTNPDFSPNCYSSTTNILPCFVSSGTSFENACPQIVTDPCPQCIFALAQKLDFTPPGLERNKIKGELIRRLAQEGDVQQLVNVLTSEALSEDKKIVIPTRIKEKEFIEAREILENIERNTYENEKFVEFFDVLIKLGETERELSELTASELAVIEAVAYSTAEVAIHAEAVLAELTKTRYIRFP
jgi:hypothetical protein